MLSSCDLVICFLELVVFIVLSSLSCIIKMQPHWITYVAKGRLLVPYIVSHVHTRAQQFAS